MPVVRPYPSGEVSPQPIPNAQPSVPAAGDTALFGGNQARDLQVAGQQLGQASDSLFELYRAQGDGSQRQPRAGLQQPVPQRQARDPEHRPGRLLQADRRRRRPRRRQHGQEAGGAQGPAPQPDRERLSAPEARPDPRCALAASADDIARYVGEQQAVYSRRVAANAIETSRRRRLPIPPTWATP